MSDPLPPANCDTPPDIEKLLDAANSASQTVAALHVAFIAFAAYLGVIIWGTTHEDLLRISPVKLPILDVELPLTTFYGGVPWLLVLLHFNLLIQLELLSRKLWNLDSNLPTTLTGQLVRDRLFIFPFAHLIAGRTNVSLINWLLSLVVGITIIALPLFMLLASQIRFLPFHDEFITWSQRVAVWVDVVMLLALWPLIASPNDLAREWWHNLGYRLFGYWIVWFRYGVSTGWNWLALWIRHRWPRLLLHRIAPQPPQRDRAEAKGMVVMLASVPMVVLLSIVAVIPGNITVKNYYDSTKDTPRYFKDWLIRQVPEVWLSVIDEDVTFFNAPRISRTFVASEKGKTSERVMLGLTSAWFEEGIFPRNLSLKEARLVPKGVSLSLLTRAFSLDKTLRDVAFKEFDGINLQERDLRFASLSGAVLLKADLRRVRLQGANLRWAQLQGADLREAQLQGAYMVEAQLQSANLGEAQLQGAVLNNTQLQGADLGRAQLQGALLAEAQLQGADLGEAQLQGALLLKTQLQGAFLAKAQLQGADLDSAQLQGTLLAKAQLQGANLDDAQMRNANLDGTQLQGIVWSNADLDGIFISTPLSMDGGQDQLQELEGRLKLLLNIDTFTYFHNRLNHFHQRLPPGVPKSQLDCYSDSQAPLECEYGRMEYLADYRAKLFPKLIDLACSSAAIAQGIAKRAIRKDQDNPTDQATALLNENYNPDFGLAATLLKALNFSKPCAGLGELSEQTRQRLREISENQKNDSKPK